MSQISQPVRIILIGAAVFLAAWFAVLRPKGEPTVPPTTTTSTTTTTTAPPAATPQTGLGRAVDEARKVAGKASATTAEPAATAAAGTTDTTGSKATTSTPDVKAQPAAISAVPAEALAKLPTDVAGALKARKVLVLAVLSQDAKPWRPVADDDRYVSNALKKTNRYKGEVVVKRVAFDNLSTYGSLVNDLDVGQSPSIVVIDRDLKGTVLTGYVDTVSINQAIADARQNSIHPNVSNDYLREVNSLCTDHQTRVARWSYPTIEAQSALLASYKRLLAINLDYRRGIKRVHAPAKFKAFKTAFVKVLDNEVKRVRTGVKAGKTRTTKDDYAANFVADRKLWRAFDKQANAVGATSCAIYRAK